jgi:hypothetical protein
VERIARPREAIGLGSRTASPWSAANGHSPPSESAPTQNVAQVIGILRQRPGQSGDPRTCAEGRPCAADPCRDDDGGTKSCSPPIAGRSQRTPSAGRTLRRPSGKRRPFAAIPWQVRPPRATRGSGRTRRRTRSRRLSPGRTPPRRAARGNWRGRSRRCRTGGSRHRKISFIVVRRSASGFATGEHVPLQASGSTELISVKLSGSLVLVKITAHGETGALA